MILLTTNTKLQKGSTDYLVAGLALAPHRRSGHNVCPEAGVCSSLCNLWFAGRTVTRTVREAMLRRTELLFEDPIAFRDQLHQEIEQWQRRATRLEARLLIRLNVASDLDWSDVIRDHPEVTFYDYTKVTSRLDTELDNYHLTYSWNERSQWNRIRPHLKRGGNVATVFDVLYNPQHGKIGPLPESWKGFPVVDGDKHDFRIPEMDGRGVVVGLRYKGVKRNRQPGIERGFVQ